MWSIERNNNKNSGFQCRLSVPKSQSLFYLPSSMIYQRLSFKFPRDCREFNSSTDFLVVSTVGIGFHHFTTNLDNDRGCVRTSTKITEKESKKWGCVLHINCHFVEWTNKFALVLVQKHHLLNAWWTFPLIGERPCLLSDLGAFIVRIYWQSICASSFH